MSDMSARPLRSELMVAVFAVASAYASDLSSNLALLLLGLALLSGALATYLRITAHPRAQCQLSPAVEECLAPVYGTRMTALRAALRRPPAMTTLRVNTFVTDRKTALSNLRRTLIDRGEEAAASALRAHFVPDVLVLPVLGPLELEMERCVVVVDVRCGEAVMRGADIFVPGIVTVSAEVSVQSRPCPCDAVRCSLHRCSCSALRFFPSRR